MYFRTRLCSSAGTTLRYIGLARSMHKFLSSGGWEIEKVVILKLKYIYIRSWTVRIIL